MSRIIDFYTGKIDHPSGASIEEIWRWGDARLELEHTYIQWLFPLPEPSRAVPGSPVLSREDIEQFKRTPELRDRMKRSLRAMLGFYGFVLNGETRESPATIGPGPGFERKSRSWLTPRNHNFLRITRMLRSMTLLGLAEEAAGFFAALQRVYVLNASVIGAVTYEYWKKAVE